MKHKINAKYLQIKPIDKNNIVDNISLFYCTMLRNTFYISITIASLLGAGKTAHAKHLHKHNSQPKQSGISLRYQAGKEMQTYSFQKKRTFTSTNGIQLRKGIGKHFNVEAGIKYTATPYTSGLQPLKTIVRNNQLSIPVTAQYTFLKEKNKVRPYCGVGFQYNIYPASTTQATPNHDVEQQNATEGNKRVSILFTQGVTFEVNTKIQVNQSFHFVPDQNMKTIGIDLGVGYKFH